MSTTGFYYNNTDFSNIFDKSSPGTQTTKFYSNNTDIGTVFTPFTSGSSTATTTKFFYGGTDLGNLLSTTSISSNPTTITFSGSYYTIYGDAEYDVIVVFTGTSTMTISSSYSASSITMRAYMVGGGGGGGSTNGNWEGGGGGGAGGYGNGTIIFASGNTYTITIGSGGSGGSGGGAGGTGGNTTITGGSISETAYGGGAGGGQNSSTGGNGGSGGGAGGNTNNSGGTATSGASGSGSYASMSYSGYSGGRTGTSTDMGRGGGGGGGSSTAGSDTSSSSNVGGNGGSGTTISFTNNTFSIAGGGGGGGGNTSSSSSGASGGTGQAGGGNGGTSANGTGSNATANTGSGGGGGGNVYSSGGSGGSGIVILAFSYNYSIGTTSYNLPSGCLFDFDAQSNVIESSVSSSSSTVEKWFDKYTNNQITKAGTPTLYKSKINTKPAIQCNSYALTTSSLSQSTCSSLTLFMVVQTATNNTSGGERQYFGTNGSWNTGNIHFFTSQLSLNGNSSGSTDTAITTVSDSSNCIFTIRINSNYTTNYRINGVLKNTINMGYSSMNISQIDLGGWNSGGRVYGGYIGHAMLFNSALSDTDVNNVEQYLSYRWKIGLGSTPSVSIYNPFSYGLIQKGWYLRYLKIYNGFDNSTTSITNYLDNSTVSIGEGTISTGQYITYPYSYYTGGASGGYTTSNVTVDASGITICCWFYRLNATSSGGGYPRIYQSSYGDGQSVMYANGSNTLTNDVSTTIGTISDNTWYHLAVAVSISNNTTKFYLNGSLATTKNTSHYTSGSSYNWTFAAKFMSLNALNKFYGYMDEIQIYGTELTATQINYLYSYPGAIVNPVTNQTLFPVYVLGSYNMSPWGTNNTIHSNSYWIWAKSNANSSASANIYYTFLYEFYSSTSYTGKIYACADDVLVSLYFNGKNISTKNSSWGSTTNYPSSVKIEIGYNLIAAYCYNYGTSDNPAGFLATLTDATGTVVATTGSRWKYCYGLYSFY